MKVKSESEDTQSCPTLSNPMVCSLPVSSIHGILLARVLEWGANALWKNLVNYWKKFMKNVYSFEILPKKQLFLRTKAQTEAI